MLRVITEAVLGLTTTYHGKCALLVLEDGQGISENWSERSVDSIGRAV
jgi:tRNA G18 (ribose-2'-O)-methylase SpoU